MKRFFALLLLSIHLFNAGGYLLLQQYQVYKTDQMMNDLISHNLYNPNALIEVKIPMHLPGYNEEWTDYKNVDGQVQLKNACYNYVKLKVTSDTLFVMVIQNYAKTKLMGKNIIYAKQVNDVPQDDKNHESSSKKGGADITYNHTPLTFKFIAFADVAPITTKPVKTAIVNPLIAVDGQPPELRT